MFYSHFVTQCADIAGLKFAAVSFPLVSYCHHCLLFIVVYVVYCLWLMEIMKGNGNERFPQRNGTRENNTGTVLLFIIINIIFFFWIFSSFYVKLWNMSYKTSLNISYRYSPWWDNSRNNKKMDENVKLKFEMRLKFDISWNETQKYDWNPGMTCYSAA